VQRRAIEGIINKISEDIKEISEKFEVEDVFFYSFNHYLKRIELRYCSYSANVILKKNLYDDFNNYLQTLESDYVTYDKCIEFTEMFDIYELEEYCIFPIFSDLRKREIPISIIIYGNRNYKNKIKLIKDDEKKFIQDHKEIVKISLEIDNKLKVNREFKRMVDFIIKIGEIRDAYNVEHQYNVAIIAEKIANEMGLSNGEIMLVKTSAMVHDCGKMMIDSEVFKKIKFTDSEMEIVKKHTIYGEKIVKEFFGDFYSETNIGKIIRCHHENYDGSGYPDGIFGNDIPLESSIIRVADSIEAMLGKRHYKNKMMLKDVKKEIVKYSGVYYNPEVVKSALKVLKVDELYNIDLKNNDVIVNAEIKMGKNVEFTMGFLRFDSDVFVFSPFLKYHTEDYDVNPSTSVNFFLSYAGKIFKYKADLLDFDNNELICSNVERVIR